MKILLNGYLIGIFFFQRKSLVTEKPKFQSPEVCSPFNLLPYLQLLFAEE